MLAKPEQQFLDCIERLIARCPGAAVLRATTGITVGASGPRGFDMAVMVDDGGYLLSFDQWEETFRDPEHARDLFEAALSGAARLRVDLLAGRRWRWTLERLDGHDRWVPESTIGQPIWRFWGRAEVTYLRNTFPQHS